MCVYRAGDNLCQYVLFLVSWGVFLICLSVLVSITTSIFNIFICVIYFSSIHLLNPGGFLSQEVVKAVSKIGDPMLNTFVFSSKDFVGKAFAAVPKA
jgi:hypothetical protein